MAETSKISWTDATFNPWIGCTKVSPGCANCYAERDWDKRKHRAKWGPMGTRSVTSEDNWKKPLRWDRKAAKEGKRVRVFCASLADVFEDWPGQVRHSSGVPMWLMNEPNGHDFCWGDGHVLDDPTSGRALKLSDLRHRLFRLIDQTPNLDWILVTKRPENIRTMWPEKSWTSQTTADSINETGYLYRPNVWLLASTEDQQRFDERVPELLRCRDLVPVLGVSAEPLLGPIDFGKIPGRTYDEIGNFWDYNCENDCGWRGYFKSLEFDDQLKDYVCPKCRCRYGLVEKDDDQPGLDWVITGGESGPDARPCHPAWVRSIRDQCQEAGVSFHHKQWGEFAGLQSTAYDTHMQAQEHLYALTWNADEETWRFPPRLGETVVYKVGVTQAGAMIDGREWREFPHVSERSK